MKPSIKEKFSDDEDRSSTLNTKAKKKAPRPSSFKEDDMVGLTGIKQTDPTEIRHITDPSIVQATKFEATFKIILIGDSGVGKSCVIKRIGSNEFNKDHEVTIGAEFTSIGAIMPKGASGSTKKTTGMKLQFWDSCG